MSDIKEQIIDVLKMRLPEPFFKDWNVLEPAPRDPAWSAFVCAGFGSVPFGFRCDTAEELLETAKALPNEPGTHLMLGKAMMDGLQAAMDLSAYTDGSPADRMDAYLAVWQDQQRQIDTLRTMAGGLAERLRSVPGHRDYANLCVAYLKEHKPKRLGDE